MSLILEALRKSEHQRQRETGPAMAVVPEAGTPRRRAAWPLIVAGLLALNVVLVAWLLFRGGEPPPSATAAPAAGQAPILPERTGVPQTRAPATRDPAPAGTNARTPLRTIDTLPLAEKPPRREVRPLAAEVGAAAQAPPATASTGTASPGDPVAAPTAGTNAGDADARLPRFSDLVVRGELNVPHLHLDIHVYSPESAERFVFINMQRYNEGQATQEGPTVERITRDGVVMRHQGRRFFLSRD